MTQKDSVSFEKPRHGSLFSFYSGLPLMCLNNLDDHVPNELRPLNINQEILSISIKLSMTILDNEDDCANISRKRIHKTISFETNTFGTSTSSVPNTRRPVYLPPATLGDINRPPFETIYCWYKHPLNIL